MRTQVSDLYEHAGEKYSLAMHGGQAGLNNSVSWVYLAEDIQNIAFLKGGELVITTGLFTGSGILLYDFISALITRNCSGILINTGKYLHPEDISAEIRELCDSTKFPVFTMPWEIHLVDIMQDFSILLLHNSQIEEQLDASFLSALYQSPVQENLLRTMNRFGFTTISEYRIMVIQNLQDRTRITSPLNSLGLKYHLFEHDHLHVLILNASGSTPSLNEIIDLICFCDSIKLGVGDTIHTLAEISLCYKRARFSLAAAAFWDRQLVSFDELGLFQILFCSSDPKLLQTIYKRHLGALAQHDAAHDSDYMKTLRVFLLSDCNILETAYRMHTHRNTIVYRMRKIKDILNSEIDNSEIKFNLMMAFYLKEYFSI